MGFDTLQPQYLVVGGKIPHHIDGFKDAGSAD
jgi:hypothetical protein